MKLQLAVSILALKASLQLVAADLPSPESKIKVPDVYPLSYLKLDHGWEIKIFGDGSAELQYGSSMGDQIKCPANTFPADKLAADSAFAIGVAPSTPDVGQDPPGEYPEWKAAVWRNAALLIYRQEDAASKGTRRIAIFTPEIKGYFDRMLDGNLSARMRSLTNHAPIFSPKVIKSLIDWTNSLEYKARSASTSVTAAVTIPSVAKTKDIPPPASGKVQPPARPVVREPLPFAGKDDSLGFRGWLVVVLLAIAAFLTYRFIRLRLGS